MQQSTRIHKSCTIKVIVGMSGGVDSSVAAYLLSQQGYQVEGLFMKNWDEDDGTEYCTAKDDLKDAQSVCDSLGIHLHTANFAAEYWDQVFEHFLQEYRLGRTPNPDVLCNREIKFKAFLDYAKHLGADFIATGHYAQRVDEGERTFLYKGKDSSKDQSYFLHQVGETELKQSLFPLGDLEKTKVRTLAESLGLVTADKKDSTGICFIGERRFKDFLQNYLPSKPGDIETDEGQIIGTHQGLMYYTLGQRQGLGIGGTSQYSELPWFVADKDIERNVLVVVQGANHPKLFRQHLIVYQPFWISGQAPKFDQRLMAKIRYRQQDQACRMLPYQNARGRTGFQVLFDQPQKAVTPGQSIVFYQDDCCLGGGVIEHD